MATIASHVTAAFAKLAAKQPDAIQTGTIQHRRHRHLAAGLQTQQAALRALHLRRCLCAWRSLRLPSGA